MGLRCRICNQIGGAMIPTTMTMEEFYEFGKVQFVDEKLLRSLFRK
jgi:hypothetical protein